MDEVIGASSGSWCCAAQWLLQPALVSHLYLQHLNQAEVECGECRVIRTAEVAALRYFYTSCFYGNSLSMGVFDFEAWRDFPTLYLKNRLDDSNTSGWGCTAGWFCRRN